MKKILRTPALKIALVLLSLSITLIFACKKGNTTENLELGKNRTAEEIYRNLIFLKGDMVASIQELNDMSEDLNKTGSKYTAQDVSKINGVVAGMKKYYPSFLEEFKKAVTSKDPSKVENAMIEASNKTMNVIFLDKFNSKVPEEMQAKFYAAVMSHPDEINKLVLERSENKLSDKELQGKIAKLFGFENLANADIATSLASQSQQAQVSSEDQGLVVLVNVLLFINVYAGVNVEFEVNIHQIQNFHTYQNVKVEFSSSAVNSLTREQLYASIAQSL